MAGRDKSVIVSSHSITGLDLGRFHEISVSTSDLDASLRFYELMGFSRGSVDNVWPHPYAVVTLGGVTLGLHEYKFPSPSFTSVHDDVNAALEAYREAGAVIAFAKTGSDCFNEFGLCDPAGHMITLLERATHPDDAWNPSSTSPALGEFLAFSLPSAAPEISAGFWQALGAEAWQGRPCWPATWLRASGLVIAVHDEVQFDRPALVFHRHGVAEGTRLESPEGLAIVIVG
jgi:catechol 2,3-dioxygenase-like lactoylglutathione lyase family enzyme